MALPPEDFKLYTYPISTATSTITTSTNNPSSSALGKITLAHDSTWTHCGESLDPTALPESLHDWLVSTVEGSGDDDDAGGGRDLVLSHLSSFLVFLHDFIRSAKLNHYWLTIRATRPNADFVVPRWHIDRPFSVSASPSPSSTSSSTTTISSSSSHETQNTENGGDRRGEGDCEVGTTLGWKLTTTLLGPGTLFLSNTQAARQTHQKVTSEIRILEDPSNDHICSSVRCVGCSIVADKVRERLAVEFENYDVSQAKEGECAFFRLGRGRGAVHSEPDSSLHHRVFVNVIPGTEEDMRLLMAKWGMSYPRQFQISWWRG